MRKRKVLRLGHEPVSGYGMDAAVFSVRIGSGRHNIVTLPTSSSLFGQQLEHSRPPAQHLLLVCHVQS